MNVQLPIHMDKPAFLAWVQGREERYELANGRVVMMVGASRGHAIIVSNLLVALRTQLDPKQWSVIADFGVDAGPATLRYPDIMVERVGGSAGEYTSEAPVLLAEVLSPTTAEIDLGDKAAEYLHLPSLVAYLVFAHNEPKAYIWRRDAAGAFTPAPQVIFGGDEIVRVDSLALALPLRGISAGVASH